MDKVLILDIETTPNLGFTWGRYEQTVIEFQKEWELLSFAYKWLGQKKTFCLSRRTIPNEASLVKCARKMLDKADVVVAHNGDQFDIKKLRSKFIQYGLTPPRPFRSIDTKKLAKKYFNFNSNSLNDLCKTLGIGKKKETGGFTLWKDCIEGKSSAFKKMERYNKQDVVILEKLYLRLRGWIYQQPTLAISHIKKDCPNCASERTHKDGMRYSRSGNKQRMRCMDCGGVYLL